MVDRQIIQWASNLIQESRILNESEIDVNEENLPKVFKFLDDNAETILEGMEFIEGNYFKLGFDKGLEKMGFELVVKPGSHFNEYKTDPTQTSSEEKNVQITQKYLEENPKFREFEDEFGWSYHEFVHALIFSGSFPKRFLDIDSPFGYPLNTDEIYTFGFQLRHIADTKAYRNLMKYEAGKIEAWGVAFDKLKEIVTR